MSDYIDFSHNLNLLYASRGRKRKATNQGNKLPEFQSRAHEQTITSNIQIQSKYYSVLKFYYHQ